VATRKLSIEAGASPIAISPQPPRERTSHLRIEADKSYATGVLTFGT
jgi:hypothetical protein